MNNHNLSKTEWNELINSIIEETNCTELQAWMALQTSNYNYERALKKVKKYVKPLL